MGIFGKLAGFAAVALAGAVVVKVAQKYDENKKEEVCAADFVNEEGNTVIKDVKKATADVYNDATDKVNTSVKNVAQNIGINTNEVTEAFGHASSAAVGVGKAVAHASVAVASKVKEEAPIVIDGATKIVHTTTEKVKNIVNPKDEELEEFLYQDEEISEYVEEEITEETSEEVVTEEVTEEVTE
ncbi:MAG: hypothetical protein R3Y35_12330 [Clostridia bacterium]